MKSIDWNQAADCLRVLAHPHRLQILHLILDKEHSVGALAEACSLLPNVASEHLSLMKAKELIRARRKGRQVFYSVQEPALHALLGCIKNRFS